MSFLALFTIRFLFLFFEFVSFFIWTSKLISSIPNQVYFYFTMLWLKGRRQNVFIVLNCETWMNKIVDTDKVKHHLNMILSFNRKLIFKSLYFNILSFKRGFLCPTTTITHNKSLVAPQKSSQFHNKYYTFLYDSAHI